LVNNIFRIFVVITESFL